MKSENFYGVRWQVEATSLKESFTVLLFFPSMLLLITHLNSSLVLLLFVNHSSFVFQFSSHYLSLPLTHTHLLTLTLLPTYTSFVQLRFNDHEDFISISYVSVINHMSTIQSAMLKANVAGNKDWFGPKSSAQGHSRLHQVKFRTFQEHNEWNVGPMSSTTDMKE